MAEMKKVMSLIGAALLYAAQAWGEIVSYVDEKGETQTTNATVVVDSTSRVTWTAGWYAVTNDVTITGGVDCSGAVNLILVDGMELTISGAANCAGIGVTGDSNMFTIYGQTAGTGILNVTGGNSGAGIGGGSDGNGSNITINGGTVTATGGKYAAGIGGGGNGSGSNITINGGSVTATGGIDGAGIGGGQYGPGANITINGGSVTATGSYYGSGIGGGYYRTSWDVYVADTVVIKAGTSPNPTEVVLHANSTADISDSLENKQYATAEAAFLARPTQVVHTTATVYTNGVLSSEAGVGSGLWYAVANKPVTVVYTADTGYCFAGGATAITNTLNTMVNPAVNVAPPPEVLLVVSYVDEQGETQTANAHIVTTSNTRVMWNAGWYVVTNDVAITGGANCFGTVKLILSDSAKLTISGVAETMAGIAVNGMNNSFMVYRQENGSGILNVSGGKYGAGIGGDSGSSGSNIAIYGGWVTVTGGDEGAGIGGGYLGAGMNIAIYDGVVMVTGGENASGIGGGHNGVSECIYAGDNVVVKAGSSMNPMEVIPHASSTTDIASSLKDKRYATIVTTVVRGWNDLKFNLEAGNEVMLTQNIAQNAQGVMIDGMTATLNLNGFKITGSSETDETYRPFTLSNGAILTLSDSSTGQVGTIDGQNVARGYGGGCVYVGAGCAFTMNGGVITNFVATGQGGAVRNLGTFTLNGGTFSDNSAQSWGNVIRGCAGSTLIITGGQIVNNNGTEVGAVSVDGTGSSTTVVVSGGVIKGNSSTAGGTSATGRNFQICNANATISGGVFDAEPSVDNIKIASAVVNVGSYSLVGSNWIVGTNITNDADNKLTGGTYTFCPTNTEYVAAGVEIADDMVVTEKVGTPTTWTLAPPVVYPDYLATYSDEVKAKFDVWATTFGSRDPDGLYANAFLLNVATNREEEAITNFAIVSFVLTNGVADIELAKPLAPATNFNGETWLQCVTNILSSNWKDIKSGSRVDEEHLFLRCRIDFEAPTMLKTVPITSDDTETIKILWR